MALSILHMGSLEEDVPQVSTNPRLWQIMAYLQRNPKSHPDYSWVQGHLIYKDYLALPIRSTLLPLLLWEFHHSCIRGHFRVFKTLTHYCCIVLDQYEVGHTKLCGQMFGLSAKQGNNIEAQGFTPTLTQSWNSLG